MRLKRLKAQGGIFRHLPLSSEYSVSLMHVCLLYKHCGFSGTALERSEEGGFPHFGLLGFFSQASFGGFVLTQTAYL